MWSFYADCSVMPKRKNTDQPTLSFKKANPEIALPDNTERLDVLNDYHTDDHAFYDTLEPEALKKAVKKRAVKISNFDDSSITAEQLAVRDELMQSTSSRLVTGEAGCGKTFVQMSLIKNLKEAKANVHRIGPTHGSIANLPNDSSTYQTFFAMPPSTDYLNTALRSKHVKDMKSAALRQGFIQRAKHRQEQSTLIIEEAGMISAEVIELIFDALESIAAGKFRVFLFFDILQLVPVDGDLLIESDKVKAIPALVLRTNMRQTGDEGEFLDLLRNIAKNRMDEYHYQMLKSRVVKKMHASSSKPTRRLCARNVTVNSHNLAHLNGLEQKPVYTFHALDLAVKKMPDYNLARSPKTLSWGVGAKVVFESTPLHEVGLYNGITGTITDVVTTDTDLILPIIYITKYDLKVVVHPYTEEIMTEASGTTAPTVQAHRTQFPFSIAEATTVHKVQGQTLDVAVEVDLKDMTSSGQIYTALSRLTKFENLTIKNLPADRYGGGMDGLRVSQAALDWCQTVGIF